MSGAPVTPRDPRADLSQRRMSRRPTNDDLATDDGDGKKKPIHLKLVLVGKVAPMPLVTVTSLCCHGDVRVVVMEMRSGGWWRSFWLETRTPMAEFFFFFLELTDCQ